MSTDQNYEETTRLLPPSRNRLENGGLQPPEESPSKPGRLTKTLSELSDNLHSIEREGESCCTRLVSTGYIKFISVAALVVISLIFLASFPFSFRNQYEVVHLGDGLHISISSFEHGEYARVAPDGAVVLTEARPWLFGSNLEVYYHKHHRQCFCLKAHNGNWIRVDYPTGDIIADISSREDASFFAAVVYNSANEGNSISFTDRAETMESNEPQNAHYIRLKVCSRDEWLAVIPINEDTSGASNEDDISSTYSDSSSSGEASSGKRYKLSLSVESLENSRYYDFPTRTTAHLANKLRKDFSIYSLRISTAGFAMHRAVTAAKNFLHDVLPAQMEQTVGNVPTALLRGWTGQDSSPPSTATSSNYDTPFSSSSEAASALTVSEMPQSTNVAATASGEAAELSTMPLHGSLFKVSTVQPLRGVNLGGWFIPEVQYVPLPVTMLGCALSCPPPPPPPLPI